jgi:hypothetical protein
MPDPVVHITSGIPDSGTGNITTLGQTLLDGANVTLGATTDAAVAAGAAATVNGHLRSISRDIVGGVVLQTGANVIGAVTQSGTWTVSGTVGATQSGTWTVQPGNTANTTAWLVTGTGGTFPVTGTFWQATQPVSIAAAVTVAQATAANLNATVTGTVAATQSGAWTVNPTTIGNWGLAASTQNVVSPTNGQLVQGQFNTSPTVITSGNSSPLQLDTNGNLLVKLNAAGTATPVTLASTTVTGTVAVTQSGAWSLTANQSVNTAQINGVAPLMGNGVTGTGSQRVTIASDNTAFTVNAAQSGAWTVNPTTIGNWGLSSSTFNTATPTNGQLAEGQYISTQAAMTSTNSSPLQVDKVGRLLSVAVLRTLKGVQKTSITVNTETTVVTAGAAGVFNDVYAFMVTNKSATAVFVDFRDATAGTVRMTLAAPASDTRGFTVPVDSAMVQATAANNWTATVSSAVTSIEITALYTSNL